MGAKRERTLSFVLGASCALAAALLAEAHAAPDAPLPLPRDVEAPASTPSADPAAEPSEEATGSAPPTGGTAIGAPGPNAPLSDPPAQAETEQEAPAPRTPQPPPHFTPVPDRWRIGFPEWDRYRSGLGPPFRRPGGLLDPYRQNVLKGDYPIRGQNIFLNLGLTSDTLVDIRSRYIPSDVSTRNPGQSPFCGSGHQDLVDQTFLLSTEVFKGDTAFRLKDWSFRFTGGFNVNHLSSRQTGVANVDVREGISPTELDFGVQELFGEYKIADLSPRYDFLSARAGIQGFTADFRGFLFVDNQPGLRFFGNTKSNRNQFNLAYFRPLDKDTYSRLNRTFQDREQDVLIANFYRQDLFRPGYTGQLVFALNNDHGDRHFNNNGIQTRPTLRTTPTAPPSPSPKAWTVTAPWTRPATSSPSSTAAASAPSAWKTAAGRERERPSSHP